MKVLACLVLGLLALTRTAHADVTEVMREIERSGNARVIITLQTGNGGTSAWSPTESAALQRQAVAAAMSQVQGGLAAANIPVIRTFHTLPFAGVVVNRQQLLGLLDMPQVTGVALVHKQRKAATTASSDPLSITLQESVASIDVPPAWAAGYQGQGVTVAIIDGGINVNHPMLAGRNVGDACFADQETGFNAECPSGQTPQISPGAASNCLSEAGGSNRCDHGSNVAGIAVGNDGTNFGVARAANYMPIDVFSSDTSASDCSPDPAPCELTDDLATLNALDYVNENATQYNVAAVNMSLGGGLFSGYCDGNSQQPIIATLRAKGIAVAVAAGNDGTTGQIEEPACISSSVAVGATDMGIDVAYYSDFATTVDFMAPGGPITSAAGSGSNMVSMEGTSMATPHVAGAFALIRAALPNQSITQIESALEATGTPVTQLDAGFSVPKPQVMQAISYLNGTDNTVFNQVVSSSDASAGLAFLRILNNSASSGVVSINLLDPTSGTVLGTWTSGSIAANAAPQIPIGTLESNAVPAGGQTIVSPTRTGYNLQIESSFPADVQYVLWGSTAGVLANLTSCSQSVVADNSMLMDVYASTISNYVSHIRITNTGAVANTATLTFYDANRGTQIATWTTPSIAAGASLDVTEPQIEAASNALATATAQGSSLYNVVLGSLSGYLQHVIENRQIEAFTDMSVKCQVPISPALQPPSQTASGSS